MFSCVKVVTSTLTGASTFTETITGVVDTKTGIPFRVRTMFLLGGNTAGPDNLTYWGMPSGNQAGDSGFHWDWGVYHDAVGGAQGGGVCHDFNLKIASGAVGYGWPFFDTWPDIFFGGYIGAFGYITNIQLGQFDITWSRKDRAGDSKILLCIDGNEYGLNFIAGAANGYHGPPINPLSGIPKAVMQMWYQLSSMGGGPAQTGAGGTGYSAGWDVRDSNKGNVESNSGSQGGNDSTFWLDRMGTPGAYIASWASDSYIVANGNGGGGMQTIWTGTDLRVKSGNFQVPASNAGWMFDCGVNAAFIIFCTVGTSVPALTDGTKASISTGFVDRGLSQACYWTGDTTVGNSVPILGARYLSTSQVIRTGLANANLTTFANIGNVTSLRSTGACNVNFTAVDGTQPMVIWMAVGTERVPDTYSGLHYINPNKPQKHDSYNLGLENKIPDPTIRTADVGS